MFEVNRKGCTRIVFLTKKFAIKVPNFLDYRFFLYGLLANMQEAKFSKAKYEGLCPVLFSLPYGCLNIMPRVREMTDYEFLSFDSNTWAIRENYTIPVESKANSFGWLDGKIVAIDYGN